MMTIEFNNEGAVYFDAIGIIYWTKEGQGTTWMPADSFKKEYPHPDIVVEDIKTFTTGDNEKDDLIFQYLTEESIHPSKLPHIATYDKQILRRLISSARRSNWQCNYY